MIHTFAPRLMVGAMALVLVVACNQASDQPSAEQALCDSLAAFSDSITAMTDLSPTTASVDDLNAARDASQEAWDQVKTDAANVSGADDAALEAAWNGLSDAITGFATDVSIVDALGQVQSAADDVRAAYGEMRDGLSCQ